MFRMQSPEICSGSKVAGDGKKGLEDKSWVLAEVSGSIMTPFTQARGELERGNQEFCLG